MDRPPLRIALVVESRRLDTWQARVVDAIGAVDAEIAAVHLVEPPAAAAAGSSRSRPAEVLRRRLTAAIDGASTPIDVATDAPVTTDDVDAGAPFDVVLDLRPAERAAAGLDARSGRWTFRFGGDDRFPPAEAFAYAALGGADAVEVVLARDGVALRAGVFGLVPYALGSGIAAAVDSFTQWPAWCLQAFAEGRGALAPFGAEPAERPAPVAAPGRGAPAASVARAARALGRKALWAEVWTVGLAEQSPASVVAGGLTDSPRWLPERGPRGLEALWRHRGFAADPFLYRGDDGQRVLFEALDYRTDRGWIAEVDVAPPSPNDRTVFRNDWHWSYPYVLEHEGVTYCVPETADAGEATLHRLTADGFEPVATLLPGVPVLDPSLVLHDGRWWLFCTHRDGPLLNTALHLYVADDAHRAVPSSPGQPREARRRLGATGRDGLLRRRHPLPAGTGLPWRLRRGAGAAPDRRAVVGPLPGDAGDDVAAGQAVPRRPPHAVDRPWRRGRRRQALRLQPAAAGQPRREGCSSPRPAPPLIRGPRRLPACWRSGDLGPLGYEAERRTRCEHLAIGVERVGRSLVPVEVLRDEGAAPFPVVGGDGPGRHLPDPLGECGHVAHGHVAVRGQADGPVAGDVGDDDREPEADGLEQGDRQALVARRQHEPTGMGVELAEALTGLEAGADDPRGALGLLDDLGGVAVVLAVGADQHQLPPLHACLGEGLDQVELSLLRREATDAEQVAATLEAEGPDGIAAARRAGGARRRWG